MGIDRKLLPDRLLRLVSPEDRQRTGLPRPISEVEFRQHMAKSMKEQPRARAKIQDFVSAESKEAKARCDSTPHGMDTDKLCAETFVAAEHPRDVLCVSRSQTVSKTPKAHGARYSLPVLLAWLREVGIPEPVFEYRFCERLWRWDVAWVPNKLACEINGGIFVQGRHNRGSALLAEYEKLSKGAALGWRVIFTTPDQLMTQATVELIKEALAWQQS